MPYCTREHIELKFGTANVAQWADLNNNEDAGEITAAIDDAIESADAQIDDTLRDSRYAVPIVPLSGTEVRTIRDISRMLAGSILYDNRGTFDSDDEGRPFNRMAVHRREAESMLRKIVAGSMKLNAVRSEHPSSEAPIVV